MPLISNNLFRARQQKRIFMNMGEGNVVKLIFVFFFQLDVVRLKSQKELKKFFYDKAPEKNHHK